jgi:dTMP kinase
VTRSAPAGCFVVLEGPEGAGKSTLAAALAARLRAAGSEPVLVREPGGTAVGERVREAFLGGDHPLSAETELLLVTAARSDLVRAVIAPALAAGRLVLADRYELSTEAYQGAGRGLPLETVHRVNALATGGLRPHLTLVLDVPPELGARRQIESGKRRDRLDSESAEFHRRVAAHYLAARGDGVRHLDGTLPAAEVEAAAWEAIRGVAGKLSGHAAVT